jgi:hypothetical protein
VRNINENNNNNNNNNVFTEQIVEEVEVTPDYGNVFWRRSKQELGLLLDG